MASSEIQIYNRALNAIGSRDDVNSVTEESREAEVCRLWFGTARDIVLRAAPWSVGRSHARLALLAQRDDTLVWAGTDPTPGFAFAYAAPSDMLIPRYLTSYERFTLGVYNDGSVDQLALMANSESPILSYTKQQTTIGLWDVQLEQAVTFALAAYICMPLTGKPARAKLLADQANNILLDARIADANSEQNTLETIPDWIAARGYAGSYPSARYFYPNGPMVAYSELPGVS